MYIDEPEMLEPPLIAMDLEGVVRHYTPYIHQTEPTLGGSLALAVSDSGKRPHDSIVDDSDRKTRF